MQKFQESDYETRTSTVPHSGMGLFYIGKRTLQPGERVLQYSGILVDATDVAQNPHLVTDRTMNLSNGKVIIIPNTLEKCKASYINDVVKIDDLTDAQRISFLWGRPPRHPEKSYNVKFVYEGDECFIEVIDPIVSGQELFVSYGRSYWYSRVCSAEDITIFIGLENDMKAFYETPENAKKDFFRDP